MKLATNKGTGWSTEMVDTTVNNGWSKGRADSKGFVHIVYYDSTNKDLKHATNLTGSWVTMTLDSTGDVGNYCDIAIDLNDRLHISYYDATNGDLKYATTAD